jgi:hypothetical protein
LCALISTVRAPKKAGEDQATGRLRGGLSTKIHALVDAFGNPVNFFLTGERRMIWSVQTISCHRCRLTR